MRALVWNEGLLEVLDPRVREIYPQGIHGCLADGLRAAGIEVRTAALADPAQGLADADLDWADALLWWGHAAHETVEDAAAARLAARVRAGLGLIVLHSGHAAKPFRALMGTPCTIGSWREAGEREAVVPCAPAHPIARGVQAFTLAAEEMYAEPFAVPPDGEPVLHSSFEGGETFRSGLCWTRDRGRIFYFRPGHETYPTFWNPNVQRILSNAVAWVASPSAEAAAKGADARRRVK